MQIWYGRFYTSSSRILGQRLIISFIFHPGGFFRDSRPFQPPLPLPLRTRDLCSRRKIHHCRIAGPFSEISRRNKKQCDNTQVSPHRSCFLGPAGKKTYLVFTVLYLTHQRPLYICLDIPCPSFSETRDYCSSKFKQEKKFILYI